MLGVGHEDAVLHVCAGMVKDYPFDGFGPNDMTLDLDPDTKPDFLMDVRRLGVTPGCLWPSGAVGVVELQPDDGLPEGKGLWPAALIDRPYTDEDAKHYAGVVHDKLPNINQLLKAALSCVRPGGKVGVLDYFVPRPPKKGVKFVGLVGVLVGFGNRMRAFSVFEREVVKTAEQKRRVSEAILGKKKPKE
jgi:xanthosine utilization system XapX-like protein